MKASIIQLVLGLLGLGFAVAGRPDVAAAYVAGSFVVWALSGRDA